METVQLIFSITALISLGFCIYLFGVYRKLLDKYKDLNSKKDGLAESEKILNEAKIQAQKHINDAVIQAQQIVVQAQNQALDINTQTQQKSKEALQQVNQNIETILSDTSHISSEVRDDLVVRLKSATSEYAKNLVSHSQEFTNFSQTILSDAAKNLQDQTLGFINAFSHKLDAQSAQTSEAMRSLISVFQQKLTQDLELQRQESHSAIEAIKEQKLKKFEDHIIDIIKLTTTDVLTNSLDMKSQEDLVRRALEDAKRKKLL